MIVRMLSYVGLFWTVVVIVVVLVGGCAAPGSGGRGGAWCDIEQPIRPSEATIIAMTKAELESAVAHNQHGEIECGWTPDRGFSALTERIDRMWGK